MNRRPGSVMLALVALGSLLASCGGGSGGGYNPGSNQQGPGNGSGTNNPGYTESAFQCPTSDTTLAHSTLPSSSQTDAVRRMASRGHGMALSSTLLVVDYATSSANKQTLDSRITALGAKTVNDVAFTHIGRSMRIVSVTPSTMTSVQSALHAIPGVKDVSPSRRLSAQVVNGPYFRGIPYFHGMSGTTAPLYQTSSVGGQWDMNVIGLGQAFDYSQAGNGSTVTNAAAIGSTGVKLAIVDTGEDVTHPDLSGATIARTRCFLTDPNNNASTGNYVTDGFGHGTDVTGIAAAASSTADYGFTGTSGSVSLMLYRVFPTPDDNCASPDSSAAQNDQQCGAADVDIASAINDAVANGANVINLSLGSSDTPCVSGQDPDSVEGDAVANAIAANVIVVASAGNDGKVGQTQPVDAPACDPGVIAVGASAYNDGQPNGTNYTGTNTEYVASYSNIGSTDTLDSSSSWGIVAPGGDPGGNPDTCNSANTSGCDNDSLHWVENIWTTTPYQANSADTSFVGDCETDEFGGVGDCRTDIEGTSMSSPHVAGAAALILSVNPSYQSPTKMKQLLCQTADDIGDPHQGCGRLNVYNAMAIAVADPDPPTPKP